MRMLFCKSTICEKWSNEYRQDYFYQNKITVIILKYNFNKIKKKARLMVDLSINHNLKGFF